MVSESFMSMQSVAGVTVIKVHGPLQLGSPVLEELRQHCSELGRQNHVRLVIDLENVPAIDPSGIGALVHGFTTMRNRGGDCKLLRPNRLTEEVLRVVGLNGVFAIFHDREQAVESFGYAA